MTTERDLAAVLPRVFDLLRRTVPASRDGDIRWLGPYFIPRRGQWWPSSFVLYRDELHCILDLGWSTHVLVWNVGTDNVRIDRSASLGWGIHSPDLWKPALDQIERRLRAAMSRPDAYNRRVASLLPLRCTHRARAAQVDLWPPRTRKPFSTRNLERLERALRAGCRRHAWRKLDVGRYLGVAAWAYDAAFPDLVALSPRDKYERRADTRHGGMLDLPHDDAEAFARWYDSRAWSGAHRFEIVFAHPHGILLSPIRRGTGWRFLMSSDTVGLYIDVARMTIALAEHGVPFELLNGDKVVNALRGRDWVEVGPFYGQLSLDELTQRRPDVVAKIRWEEPPRISVL